LVCVCGWMGCGGGLEKKEWNQTALFLSTFPKYKLSMQGYHIGCVLGKGILHEATGEVGY
jgi:hypothetical protein